MSFPFKVVDGMKQCAVDYCSASLHALGLCHYHYYRNMHGRPFYGPLVEKKKTAPTPKPLCDFPDCPNLATAIKGGLCMGHYQQKTSGRALVPLVLKNHRFSSVGRVCKVCKEDKPLSEYYARNRGNIATQCKECFKIDSNYWQGRSATRADGSDPKGWKDDPEAREARYDEVKARAKAR